MRTVAHCMPIYLLGSLQYFADVRTANALNNAAERFTTELGEIAAAINAETTTTPGDSCASAEAHAPGVAGGEGEGRT